MNTFQQFYKDNREKLFGYLLRKSGNQLLAADIMQESFTRYLEHYRSRDASPSLLYTISRNLLRDHLRSHRLETPFEEEFHGALWDQEGVIKAREESRRVLVAMQQLDEDEQDLLSLVTGSGLSYKEISKITGISEANIKAKVHRSRTKLRKILQQGES